MSHDQEGQTGRGREGVKNLSKQLSFYLFEAAQSVQSPLPLLTHAGGPLGVVLFLSLYRKQQITVKCFYPADAAAVEEISILNVWHIHLAEPQSKTFI